MDSANGTGGPVVGTGGRVAGAGDGASDGRVAGTGGRLVFGIGEPGAGPNQFGPDWPQEGPPLRVFIVGVDDVGVAWPAFHPGPLDAYHGWRSHRIEVEFELRGPGPGDGPVVDGFELALTFFASHGPCPDIEVITGSHSGTFRPDVDRRDRSEVWRQGPTAGRAEVKVWLPAPWFTPGANRISVATVLGDDYREGADRHGGRPLSEGGHPFYGSWFGSGITWDSVALREAVAGAGTVAGAGAAACPTRLECSPRHRREEPGGQVLRLSTALRRPDRPATVAKVVIGDVAQEVELAHEGRDFGQLTGALTVPEISGPAQATVTIDGEMTEHALSPGRKWTVHLVPHVHLDLGYTDYQGKVMELHSRNLDRAAEVLSRDPSFKFTVDGSLIVREFLATRSPEAAGPVIAALRSGALGVNAFHSLFLAGVASLEEMLRSSYNSAELRSAYGVRTDVAHLTDVPSYPVSMPSVLAHLGATAFAGIVNHSRGATGDSDLEHLLSPVMWEGPDGSRTLTFFVDSYSQLRFLAGDPQVLGGAARALDQFLERYERPDYVPSDLLLLGSHADNEDLGDGDADFVRRWNNVYDWPRMVVSNLADYFDAVRPLAGRLPVWRGDGGSFWEDGVGTGAAIEAMYRRAQMVVPVAENLAALTAWTSGGYAPHRQALDGAWEGLLIGCEHTWTWAHWVSHPKGSQGPDQLDWKRQRVHQAWRTGTDESRRALSQLAEEVTTGGGTELLVYNPLSWARDADVEVEMPAGQVLALGERKLPFEVIDDLGGSERVRLTVPALPAFGYATVRAEVPATAGTNFFAVPASRGEVTVGRAGALAGGGTEKTGTEKIGTEKIGTEKIESERWLVTLDGDGMVRGLVHRASGRQLLDPGSPWPLACLLYASDEPPAGGWEATAYPSVSDAPVGPLPGDGTAPGRPTSVIDRRPLSRPFAPAIYPARMRSAGVARTYDGWRVEAAGEAPSLPAINVSVLLRDSSDTVEISVRLHKEYRLAKESVYAAFAFALDDPVVRYDRQLGWVDPSTDHSPGSCTEWFTTQFGVVASSGRDGPAVAWCSSEAPLFSVGDIVRGRWPDAFEVGNGYLFSWLMNNHWPTNTAPAQEGPLEARFAFAPMPAFDPARASRLGREFRVPAAASWVTPLDKADARPRRLPAGGGRVVDLCAPETVQVTVATARDGRSLLLRVQDLTGAAQNVRLRHPAGPSGTATLAGGDERLIGPIEVDGEGFFNLSLARWSVATVLLHR